MGNLPGGITDKLKHRKPRKQSSSRSSIPTEPSSPIGNTHLETFLLVWLDPHVDTNKENVRTQEHLRKILTCLITFNKVETCEKWLEKCCLDEKIILIVSGAYGQEIVPKIHDLTAIISIYIYCLDVERNKIWSKDYPKIRSVQSVTDTLIQELSHNQTNLEKVEDSKALKIYQQEEQIYSLDTKTASLIWYQLLLEILICPDYIHLQGTYHELIHILRQYSSNDEYGSNLIDEFERTYESKRALSWLIRDTPLVRFVNKALREQDINILFVLRFLLIDIHRQLIENQAHSLNVFKLLLMPISQMEDLKANPGQLIVVHGFLFASTNMSQLISTVTNNDQFETVLLDIKADFRVGVTPFAFLRHIDSNIEEQIDREVLFMCGSIFEVGPLIHENSIWKLRLRLASENDIPILFNMKQKLKDNQNLNIIADLLHQCNEGGKATIYSERLHYELSQQNPSGSQMNQQLKKNNSKSNLTANHNVSFILVNLSEHLTDFASAVLKTLCSLASKRILIINDESTIDFSQWSKKPIAIFTTAEFASTIETFPKDFQIFLLDKEKKNIEQQRFTTIDDLISRLADEIIHKYRVEASENTEAEEQNKQINRIYRELRQIHEKFATNKSPMKASDRTAPVLIWFISKTKHNKEDTNYIQENFGYYFSSSRFFTNENDFHDYITKENTTDIFLIIDSNDQEATVKNLRQFPHIKHVYRYGELQNDEEKITPDRDNLRYHLTYDLMDYYGKLGEQYRTNNQPKKAREMFLKAQTLCQFLSTDCFPST